MGLDDGDNAVVNNYFTYREYNSIKNHWRQADPVANLSNEQPGMIVSDSDDELLYHITVAGSNQIAQGAIMPSATGGLEFLKTVVQNITCWESIASGNPYFYIYGYKTAVGVKYLRSYVHTTGDAYIDAEQNLLLTTVASGRVGIPSSFFNFGSGSAGIVSGAFTATQTWMKLTPETSAHDALITINGGSEGDLLILTCEDATYNVTVDESEATNITMGGDCSLWANNVGYMMLIKIESLWYEVARTV